MSPTDNDVTQAVKVGSSKMTERVSKLLTQAERAPEGSPEREAFMERAMALSQAYSIDLAMARMVQTRKERAEEPEERRYQTGVVGRPAAKHMTDLMLAICGENDLQVLISRSATFVYAHGMPSDHDVVERLFAMLSAQMVAEADAGLRRGDHKEERGVLVTERVEIPELDRRWGGFDAKSGRYYDEGPEDADGEVWSWEMNRGQGGYRKPFPPPSHRDVPVLDADGNHQYVTKTVSAVDGRVWRANFYAGFVARTRTRLRAAKRKAMEAAGIDLADVESAGAVALRDKAKTVRESWEETNRVVLATSRGKGYVGAQVSAYTPGGRDAGDAAARRARLGDENDLPGR